MTTRTTTRRGALVGPLAVACLLLAGCGASDSEASEGTIVPLDTGQTNYQTIAPETTEPPAPVDTATQEDDPEPAGSTSDYVVKAGDIPNAVANKFGITFQQLQDANPGTDFATTFNIGMVIKIPGGGSSGSSDASSSGSSEGGSADGSSSGSSDGGSADGSSSGSDAEETGETVPSPGDNCSEGSYTVASGDFPNSVAQKFGVSFDRLQAANPSVDFLTSFPVGLEITIPAKEDC
ncbi:LysM peptidoglycan-binding domain-containing protein [Ilumatobacter sp.]|uniref:LysM peptidoglycan-binding domain-containing protein n=1 Tax=Ilumatobacter sp. TaxID=1967498 RepID=UPI003B51B73B